MPVKVCPTWAVPVTVGNPVLRGTLLPPLPVGRSGLIVQSSALAPVAL